MIDPQKFLEEFQDTHYRYLKEIYHSIINLYGKDENNIVENILKTNRFKDSFINKFKKNPKCDEYKSILNLKNSWYHEIVMNHPYGEENINERMRFLPWKIIQFYYSIYCSISSVVRCFNTKPNLSHDIVINLYSDQL